MKKKILVTANNFGSTKSNSSQSPKHHFCYECARACCISSSHLILSSTASLCKARARTHAHPTATAFVATAPRVALIFVARIVNIVSCNKIFFFHGLPLTLLQLFYFTLVRCLSFICGCLKPNIYKCKFNLS
jgi:hypothetical protein